MRSCSLARYGHASACNSLPARPATPSRTEAQHKNRQPHATNVYMHAHVRAAVRRRLDTTKAALRIYDPFFCEGRMVAHMASLGFESVYNRNEDFYKVSASTQ